MGGSLLLASAVSCLGGVVFGYELGIISGALLQLKSQFSLSCVQQEALVSSLLIGGFSASVVGGCLIDRYGRRKSILLSNVLVLGSSLVLAAGSYGALLLGRLTVGFAMCLSSMSCCIFVSELVAPDCRGLLVTLYEGGITVGILAAYAINYFLSGSRGGWRWMFGLAVVPTLFQLLSIWLLPPAIKEASDRKDHGRETQRADQSEASSPGGVGQVGLSSWYLLRREDNMRTRTIIGLGLVLFQQFTGQPNILFYASTIFRSVGFHSDSSAVLASVGLGVVKVAATLVSMLFSDRLGRRPLLIGGCCVMALALTTIGLLLGHSLVDAPKPCGAPDLSLNATHLPPLPDQNGSDRPLYEKDPLFRNSSQEVHGVPGPPEVPLVNRVILGCMMAVVGAYSIGFGPMTWLLLSEIFPEAVRGRAFAFTNCFNWAAHLLVTFTFLNLIDVMGLAGMFLVYGLTAVVAALFFYFLLPETKGKSLEEIDRELRLARFCHNKPCWSRFSSIRYRRLHNQVSSSA